ncbi:nucleopolyhedrovirus P10 family protein [Streptomyces sp. NPDC087226]|uniref:nucleopolyhedrovirus P10 family protein n=1 Tax=Streptomyces sp. NPDC087226 TaxID=3365771 RepID=UPI003823FD35
MTADRWTRMVREQVGLGRIVPLGGARDGAWITERAVGAVLRRAVARGVPGVRVDGVRVGPVDPEEVGERPVVPAPVGALGVGALRLVVEFAATGGRPLPETSSVLRGVLGEAVVEGVGLAVVEVDLRVTELLDAEPVVEPVVEPGVRESAGGPVDSGDFEVGRVGAAVLRVPGVSRLTGVLGRAVHITEEPGEGGAAALPRRHVRVDLAVGAGARPLDVAREVRGVVASVVTGGPTVAVLVTTID